MSIAFRSSVRSACSFRREWRLNGPGWLGKGPVTHRNRSSPPVASWSFGSFIPNSSALVALSSDRPAGPRMTGGRSSFRERGGTGWIDGSAGERPAQEPLARHFREWSVLRGSCQGNSGFRHRWLVVNRLVRLIRVRDTASLTPWQGWSAGGLVRFVV
jgi:hypothetical protein